MYFAAMWRKSPSHERLHYIIEDKPLCGASWVGSIPPLGFETRCRCCEKRITGDAKGNAWPKTQPKAPRGWANHNQAWQPHALRAS